MGWGAAYALFEECGDWLDSPDDAYAMLYGDPDKPAKKRTHRCPHCGRKLKSQAGRDQHIRDVHARIAPQVQP